MILHSYLQNIKRRCVAGYLLVVYCYETVNSNNITLNTGKHLIKASQVIA